MNERPGVITFQARPLTLLGTEVVSGMQAPAFTALGGDLAEVALSDYQGKVLLIAAVPSLDTGVCDAETRRFNAEAASLGDGVSVLVVSMDLPFAQQRWCGAAGIENVRTLSDHRDASFGKAYGVLIKELRLLARAVWVVNADGEVRYAELVREITDEPDYDSALEVARELLA